MRTNVYVDGFNLYYGLKHYERQGLAYKWLDLADLCRRELLRSTIVVTHLAMTKVIARRG